VKSVLPVVAPVIPKEVVAEMILDNPKIIHYPESVGVGSVVEIVGKSPNENQYLTLWLEEEGKKKKSYLIKSDEDKIFFYTTDPIEKTGVVKMRVETIENKNLPARSSNEISIDVKDVSTICVNTKEWDMTSIIIVSVLAMILLLLFILLLLLAIIYIEMKRSKTVRNIIIEEEVQKLRGVQK
jgi:hypothetical protein